jgi:preprotein translocase subunit SecG
LGKATAVVMLCLLQAAVGAALALLDKTHHQQQWVAMAAQGFKSTLTEITAFLQAAGAVLAPTWLAQAAQAAAARVREQLTVLVQTAQSTQAVVAAAVAPTQQAVPAAPAS